MRKERETGLALVEFLLALMIIGLIVALAISRFLGTREMALKNACLANIALINKATELYYLDKGKYPPNCDAIYAYLEDINALEDGMLVCPKTGDRSDYLYQNTTNPNTPGYYRAYCKNHGGLTY
jgi:competence protein ComGC